MVLSRRKFLTQIAAISGMGAAFLSMQGLDGGVLLSVYLDTHRE
jgi:hypothetical protein